MPVEQLTYAQIAERVGVSSEAARALAKRMRLPRSRANDGKTLVAVDLAEIQHKPLPSGRSPRGNQPVTGIAAIFQLSVNCLRKHFAHELLHGRAQKRAENLRRLEAAAQGGAVTAMRVLHLVYDKAEAQELHDVSDDDERRERAETAVLERPSKKALERRAALSAGEGTDWGTDLLPPADWRQPLSPP
jgi:hypothetical protein